MCAVLADWQIERDIKITPFEKGQTSKGVVSYGLGSYGYDARLGYKFRVFTNTFSRVIDPKDFDPKAFVEVDVSRKDEFGNVLIPGPPGNYIDIPPNSFALGETLEEFELPRDVLAIVIGKSTYARCGLVVNVTPGEPEWKGRWTLELSNTAPLPLRVYAGEGIAQVYFLRSDGYGEGVRQVLEDLIAVAPERHLQGLWRNSKHHLGKERTSCRVSYADKKGKYQDQTGLTLPFVKKE